MLKTLKTLAVGAALTLALGGCVTRGADFTSDLSWITKGKTTQTEVEKYLGAPSSVGNSGGTPTWTYGFYNYKLFGESRTKELKFYWNKELRVDDFSFNSSFPEDRRRIMLKPQG